MLKRRHLKLMPWAGLLGIAIVLRLTMVFGLGTLWADEAFSWHFARKPFMEMLELLRFDVHPPFHAALLWVWFRLFDDSALVMRLLSFFLGIGGLVTFKLLGLRLYGKRVSFIALMLAALSPLMIYYAADGRMYALIIFLSTLSALALWEHVRGNRHALSFWFYASFALALTHVTGALVVLGQAGWLFFHHRARFRDLFWHFAGIGLVFAIWFIPAAARKITMLRDEWQFRAGEQAVAVHEALTYWLWVPTDRMALFITSVIIGLLILGGLFRHSKRKPHFNFSDRSVFLLWWLAAVVTPFAVVGATVSPRYLAAAAPPLFLLLAHGFMNVSRRKWLGVAVAGGLIVIFTFPGIAAQLSVRAYNWDENAAWIEERWREGDKLVFGWYANALPFEAAGGFSGTLNKAGAGLFYPFEDDLSWDERHVAHAGTLVIAEKDIDRHLAPLFEGTERVFFVPNHFLRLQNGVSAGPAVNAWLEWQGWRLADHLPARARTVGVWLFSKE